MQNLSKILILKFMWKEASPRIANPTLKPAIQLSESRRCGLHKVTDT